MNCSSTRACISLFEVLPEPPRIMLTSPRSSTSVTAAIAMVARIVKSVDIDLVVFRSKPGRPSVSRHHDPIELLVG